jgi:antibiotic biosynthesis monooxygenase (ABM) superfamily enzyme
MSASAGDPSRPATVVVSRRVHDGEARQFRRWLRRLRRQIRRAPGFLDYRVHPPLTGLPALGESRYGLIS